jgi:MoaA/NifB/PqqE/SkfB family radical SAM enzyme
MTDQSIPSQGASKSNGLFCSRPFTSVEITGWGEPKGDVFACCPNWLPTPIGNVLRQSMEEIWNGEIAQKIRESIHDGSFRYCIQSRCPHLQSVNKPVQPKETVDEMEMRDIIESRLTVMPCGPREVRCSYDKSCNLSCPTCRTELIVERDKRDDILAINKILRETWLADTRCLSITGSGDPFGSPFFRSWLQTMRRHEMPRLENLHLSSNAIGWTPRQWEAIPSKIRELILSTDISIDAATAETYAINRRGGNFERLLENLEFISSLRRDGPLKHVGISFVVQDNNFKEMPAFVRLGMNYGFDLVYFGQLLDWGTFSEEELKRRSVHFPDHPRHSELLRVLCDDIFQVPIAYLGNLSDLVHQARGAPRRPS